MREKTVNRSQINTSERKQIMQKSSGRCAHCGKVLSLKTATIDHAVPISKGGTNEFDNLVALCFDCNINKFDAVVDPVAYFKYLLPEHVKAIKSYHDKYCEDISWLSPKNFMKEDRIEVQYASYSKMFNEHRTRKGNNVIAHCMVHTAILYKASYEDLNDVRAYLIRYHKKYDLYLDELDEAISNMFSLGCIYILKRGMEILAIFPVKIEKVKIAVDESCYLVSFSGIPVLYQRYEYYPLIEECIQQINVGIVLQNGLNIAVYEIHFPTGDEFVNNIVEKIGSHGKMIKKESDGWCRALFCQRWAMFEEDDTVTKFNVKDDFRYYSRSLERILNLKPANGKVKVANKKKDTVTPKAKISYINKEKRRMKREEIDEYDERYYK